MLIKEIRILFIILFCILLEFNNSFSQNTITKEKLQGEWISMDGDIIIFKNDSCLTMDKGHFLKYVLYADTVILPSEKYSYASANRYTDSRKIFLTIKEISNRNLQIIKTIRKGDTLMGPIVYIPLNKIPFFNKDFKVLYYGSTTCFGVCPSQDLEIDSNACVFYNGMNFVDNKGLFKSKLDNNVISWLQYFLSQSRWDTLRKHYSSEITDNPTHALSIRFMNNEKYTVYDYANSSPNPTLKLFKFLRNVALIVDINYFSGLYPLKEKHFFDDQLVLSDNILDSIKYMSSLDSLNYKLPVYPGANDIEATVDSVVTNNLNHTLWRSLLNTLFDLNIEYRIRSEGTIDVLNENAIRKELKKNLIDSTDSANKVNQLYSNIVYVFMKLPRIKSGIYNGLKISVYLSANLLIW